MPQAVRSGCTKLRTPGWRNCETSSPPGRARCDGGRQRVPISIPNSRGKAAPTRAGSGRPPAFLVRTLAGKDRRAYERAAEMLQRLGWQRRHSARGKRQRSPLVVALLHERRQDLTAEPRRAHAVPGVAEAVVDPLALHRPEEREGGRRRRRSVLPTRARSARRPGPARGDADPAPLARPSRRPR